METYEFTTHTNSENFAKLDLFQLFLPLKMTMF